MPPTSLREMPLHPRPITQKDLILCISTFCNLYCENVDQTIHIPILILFPYFFKIILTTF